MLALAAWPAGAQAPASPAPLQLRPVGSWTADFADDRCALRRSFTDGTTTVLFEMGQAAPGSNLEVAVASATLERRQKPPRTQFLPGDGPREATSYRLFTTQGGLTGLAVGESMMTADDRQHAERDETFAWPEADRDAREHAISGFVVTDAFDKDFVVLTGPLEEPMNVMRACLDDLLTRWGLDPAAHRTLSRNAAPDFRSSWVRRVAQRQKSLIDDRNPTVRARLIVDEAGKVTACKLLAPPSEPDDANAFCGEMQKRAQFAPALDSGGQPLKSVYMWEMTRIQRATV